MNQLEKPKKKKKIFDRRSMFFSISILILFSFIYYKLDGVKENRFTKGESLAVVGSLSAKQQLEVASSLKNNGLYDQAAVAFDEYAKIAGLEGNDLINLYYNIGNLYFNDSQYEKAITYFYKAQIVDKQSPLSVEINTKIINSLERLGKSMDAQNVLNSFTSLNLEKSKSSDGSAVVAKIGAQEITLADINHQIEKMPQWLREQLKDNKQKLEFAKQYIATEIFYRKAFKLGLDKDKELILQLEEMKKQLMVQALMTKEMEQIKIDDLDVENYYKANSAKYEDKAQVKIVTLEFKTADEARTALKELSVESQFEEVKRKAETADIWLTFDNCDNYKIDKKLVEVALTLAKGKISDVIEVNNMVYLLKVIDKKAAKLKTYAEVKDQVRQEYTMLKQQQVSEKMLKEALSVEDLEVYPQVFEEKKS